MGSNIGHNLLALKQLLTKCRLSAVEINKQAVSELKENLPEVDLQFASILEFHPIDLWDLVFTKGVLIHINPDKLPMVYDLMYKSSSHYILIAEY